MSASAPRYRIGLVTCGTEKLRDYFPTVAEPDFVPTEQPFTPDDQILVDELRRHGHDVRPVVWGCPVEELAAAFDALVVRSPWDYMDSDELRGRFMSWIMTLNGAGVAIENHPRFMFWLGDKRYLNAFERCGVPTVPTRVVSASLSLSLAEEWDRRGPLIVKPSVSAAGAGLVFLELRAEAEAFETEFHARTRTVEYLVQPFVQEIRTAGEWSLVYLGGVYSHAVHKLPAAGKILVHAEQGGSLRFADAPTRVRAVGDLVADRCADAFSAHDKYRIDGIRFPPLYLRIDVIESAAGPLLSECEGIEPELFFRARPGSERRFRELLEERLRS